MSQPLLVWALALGVTVLNPADISEVAPRPGGPPPRPGEYTYVEQLPKPIEKVSPVYPERARERNISGTVVVKALVGKDGRIKETLVLRSIPELDAAAVASVKQWRFKPAMTDGSPVAIWVAIPVKFTLQ